jgi:hypothetical protein
MGSRPIIALLALATSVVIAGVASATAENTDSGAALKRRGVTCPDHYQRPKFTDYPALHRVMVPRKSTRLLVCRYAGLNAEDPQALRGSGLAISGARIRVVRAYNKLPKPPPKPVACPADTGREITMEFRYRHRPKAFLLQDMTGCRVGTNGHRSVTALNGRGHRLLRLLRKVSGA